MMNSKTKRIIRQIAMEHGTTPDCVEAEMREAIRKAMDSTDPKAQVLWKQIAPDGREPDIDCFLEFISQRVRQKIK